jgi:putative ATPase
LFTFQTTLAKIIAAHCKKKQSTRFVQISATSAGKADIAEVIKVAKNEQKMFKRGTILFVDEIHRFNKLQQVRLSCDLLKPLHFHFRET